MATTQEHPGEVEKFSGSSSRFYHCSLVTPGGKIFESEVISVSAPGKEGSFSVLARHAPVVSILNKGILKISKGEETIFFAIDSGILEVSLPDHSVLILVDQAEKITQPQAVSH